MLETDALFKLRYVGDLLHLQYSSITVVGNSEVHVTSSCTEDYDNRWWFGGSAPINIEMLPKQRDG